MDHERLFGRTSVSYLDVPKLVTHCTFIEDIGVCFEATPRVLLSLLQQWGSGATMHLPKTAADDALLPAASADPASVAMVPSPAAIHRTSLDTVKKLYVRLYEHWQGDDGGGDHGASSGMRDLITAAFASDAALIWLPLKGAMATTEDVEERSSSEVDGRFYPLSQLRAFDQTHVIESIPDERLPLRILSKFYTHGQGVACPSLIARSSQTLAHVHALPFQSPTAVPPIHPKP